MKGTQDNVKGEPGKQQPAGPTAAQQQENTSEDREDTHERNRQEPGFERALEQVIDQADESGKDEEGAEDSHGQRTYSARFSGHGDALGSAS